MTKSLRIPSPRDSPLCRDASEKYTGHECRYLLEGEKQYPFFRTRMYTENVLEADQWEAGTRLVSVILQHNTLM